MGEKPYLVEGNTLLSAVKGAIEPTERMGGFSPWLYRRGKTPIWEKRTNKGCATKLTFCDTSFVVETTELESVTSCV